MLGIVRMNCKNHNIFGYLNFSDSFVKVFLVFTEEEAADSFLNYGRSPAALARAFLSFMLNVYDAVFLKKPLSL